MGSYLLVVVVDGVNVDVLFVVTASTAIDPAELGLSPPKTVPG